VKRTLLILALVCLLEVPAFSFPSNQKGPLEPIRKGKVSMTMSEVSDFPSYFIGVRHESQFKKTILTVGMAVHLGGGFYNLSYGDFGSTTSINIQGAWLTKIGPLFAGPLAGPDVEMTDPITYVRGAAGLIVTCGGKVGGWLAWKKVFEFGETPLKDGWLGGGGLYINF